MSNAPVTAAAAWGADFFGTLNEMPSEPIGAIAQILETMRTEPAFQGARRAMLADLQIGAGGHVLDAGCGTGAALPDLLEVVGADLRVVGIDPTEAFVQAASARARDLGTRAARYEVGDIRAIPATTHEFDAAFCDKILIHVGPASAALGEMVRVTRPGGRVGAVEWLPSFAFSTSRPETMATLNSIFARAVYDLNVSANLARHFRAAGLTDVRTSAYLAHTSSLNAHPFWRAFLIHQLPLFVHAGLISETQARGIADDLEAHDTRGELSISFIVQTAVGTVQTAAGTIPA